MPKNTSNIKKSANRTTGTKNDLSQKVVSESNDDNNVKKSDKRGKSVDKKSGVEILEIENFVKKYDVEILEIEGADKKSDNKNIEKENVDKKPDNKNMKKESVDKKPDNKNIEKENVDKKPDNKNIEKENVDKKSANKNIEKENVDKKSDNKNIEKETVDKKPDNKNIEKESVDKKTDNKNIEKESADKKNDNKNIEKESADKKSGNENSAKVRNALVSVCLLFLILLGFDIYHFSTYNHNKTSEKQLKKQVLKLQEKQQILNIKYGDIIYLGDSITEYYNFNRYYNYPIVKSGISGYNTDDILNNLDSMVFNYEPKKIFLLIGTNDLVKKTPGYVIDNIKKIVETIEEKKPNVKIYIQSVYPINNTDNEKISHMMVKNRTNEGIREINEGIKLYCEEKDITYIDMYKLLADSEGNLKLDYTIEGLHLSDEAYEVISKELKKYIL